MPDPMILVLLAAAHRQRWKNRRRHRVSQLIFVGLGLGDREISTLILAQST
jgi:hypothetical protein